MKNKILVIAVLMSINNAFSQYIIIHRNAETSQHYKISEIDSLTFCPETVNYAGKDYNVVVIGDQCWLKENLDVGTRINGSSNQTNNSTIEKYCYNDLDANCSTYGGLYQWAEAVQYHNGATNTTSPDPTFTGNVQGICPTGWHIPTKAEFQTLKTAVNNDGNALKEVGQGTGGGAGTNTSGFSALLAGDRGDNGNFYDLDHSAFFWSSTELNASQAHFMLLFENSAGIDVDWNFSKVGGFSIRCLKD